MAALTWIALLIAFSAVHTASVPEVKGEYTVEYYVVIDHSAYVQWYNFSKGSTELARRKDTIALINKQYDAMVHDLDVIYRAQFKPGLQLSVVLTGIKVLTEKGVLDDPSGEVEGKTLLNAFWEWVKEGNLKDSPRHDHATLVTGLQMLPKNHKVHAFKDSICKPNSLSVIKNNYGYHQVFRMAQEIAHSFGATEDGRNGCRFNRNMMTFVLDVKVRDLWHWSSCTDFEMQNRLGWLNWSQKNKNIDNCLEKRESKPGPSLGELYSADEMCAFQEGEGSFLCRHDYNRGRIKYGLICRNMRCRERYSITMGGTICTEGLGLDGLSCGDKKICHFGKCVYNENAESKPENCPQGDQPGRVITTKYTCAELIKYTPHYCYRNFYKYSCCESCRKLETGNKDCLYGDRGSWCAKLDRRFCSRKQSKHMCCATCR